MEKFVVSPNAIHVWVIVHLNFLLQSRKLFPTVVYMLIYSSFLDDHFGTF